LKYGAKVGKKATQLQVTESLSFWAFFKS